MPPTPLQGVPMVTTLAPARHTSDHEHANTTSATPAWHRRP